MEIDGRRSTIDRSRVEFEVGWLKRLGELHQSGDVTSLYVFIYVLLRVEAYALLVGAAASLAQTNRG